MIVGDKNHSSFVYFQLKLELTSVKCIQCVYLCTICHSENLAINFFYNCLGYFIKHDHVTSKENQNHVNYIVECSYTKFCYLASIGGLILVVHSLPYFLRFICHAYAESNEIIAVCIVLWQNGNCIKQVIGTEWKKEF